MELEIHKYLPMRLVPKNALELDLDDFILLYTKANYMKDLGIMDMQQAIARAFSD